MQQPEPDWHSLGNISIVPINDKKVHCYVENAVCGNPLPSDHNQTNSDAVKNEIKNKIIEKNILCFNFSCQYTSLHILIRFYPYKIEIS